MPKTNRLASGYREYDPATVALVRFIKNAQELGFTLNEISELISLRANPSRIDEDVRRLAARKVEAMDQRIRQLSAMRGELAVLVERCGPTSCVDNCVIIDAFDDAKSAGRSHEPPSTKGGNRASQ